MKVEYLGDGVWRFTFFLAGSLLTARVSGEPGIAADFHDRGRIVVESDQYLGDLTTDADDVVLTEIGLASAGKRAFYGGDFCAWFLSEME